LEAFCSIKVFWWKLKVKRKGKQIIYIDETSKTNLNVVYLGGRAGSIQAAINLEIDSPDITHINVKVKNSEKLCLVYLVEIMDPYIELRIQCAGKA
jgi:hypothetical protein